MAWNAEGWMEFLNARAVCIRSMVEQGCSYEEICKTLNLSDPDQARRIYDGTTEHPVLSQ